MRNGFFGIIRRYGHCIVFFPLCYDDRLVCILHDHVFILVFHPGSYLHNTLFSSPSFTNMLISMLMHLLTKNVVLAVAVATVVTVAFTRRALLLLIVTRLTEPSSSVSAWPVPLF